MDAQDRIYTVEYTLKSKNTNHTNSATTFTATSP